MSNLCVVNNAVSDKSWNLWLTRQAQKDFDRLASAGMADKARELLTILKSNPFQTPPPYEKLVGDLAGAYSRRLNVQHRLVYSVNKESRDVKIIRMWTHYE
jgi:Txe/YoeB family toxin of toxin-antitoxin system